MRNLLGFLLLVGGCCGSQCEADVYQISACEIVNGVKTEGKGTAVCVGTQAGRSILLTARHIVRGCEGNTWVAVNRKWRLAENVRLHPTCDLAIVEINETLIPTPIGSDLTPGMPVSVDGYGPLLHGQNDDRTFSGTIDEVSNDDIATLVGDDGRHAMPGDSGGAVLAKSADSTLCCVGIVSWHEGGVQATSRRSYQRQRTRARTGFISAKTITRFVETQYGRCGSGGCPIQIRPMVQQPFFGPFPVGPPRVIGVAEPVPQTYVPVRPQYTQPPVQQSQPVPDPISVTGPRGERGPEGPPGEDGTDGKSVTQEQVQIAVDTYLESNIDRLKAPPITQDQIDLSVRKHFEANPVTVTAPSPAEPVDDRRLLYFTSTEGCANCRETDATVARLKASGYPITVIDLEPTETQVRGVPRLHVLKETRDISGASNVSTYLGLLVR